VRQQSPYELVLDDQPFESQSPSRGKGLILRWRDGAVTEFSDHTYATIEDGRGERVTAAAALEVFARRLERDPRQDSVRWDRHAKVVSDGKRAFAPSSMMTPRAWPGSS
jgi:hypothetical protein